MKIDSQAPLLSTWATQDGNAGQRPISTFRIKTFSAKPPRRALDLKVDMLPQRLATSFDKQKGWPEPQVSLSERSPLVAGNTKRTSSHHNRKVQIGIIS